MCNFFGFLCCFRQYCKITHFAHFPRPGENGTYMWAKRPFAYIFTGIYYTGTATIALQKQHSTTLHNVHGHVCATDVLKMVNTLCSAVTNVTLHCKMHCTSIVLQYICSTNMHVHIPGCALELFLFFKMIVAVNSIAILPSPHSRICSNAFYVAANSIASSV